MNDETWRDRATCASVGGDWWFPEQGGLAREAKEICAACPVAAQCLQYALDNDETEGIWAGTTPRQRRAMKRPAPVYDGRYDLIVSRTLAGYTDEAIARELGVHVRTVFRIRARRAA